MVGTAVALAAAVAFWVTRSPPDPVYQGKHLSEWLGLWGTTKGKVAPPEEREKAADAIRHIGSNAVPTLLAWMAYEPPVFRYGLVSAYRKLPAKILTSRAGKALLIQPLVRPRKTELALNATDAFAILGPQAESALPELIRRARLNGSEVIRYRYWLALAQLGKPAVPTISDLLANEPTASEFWTRGCSILALGTNATPLVPILIKNLRHTNAFVVMRNARMLGELKLAPDLAVPALADCLKKSEGPVRNQVTLALMDFGDLAQGALPALTNALADSDPVVRTNAAQAIQKIAPLR